MGDLAKMDKPKTWGTACVHCGYRWCFRGRACLARQMRAEKRARKSTETLIRLRVKEQWAERFAQCAPEQLKDVQRGFAQALNEALTTSRSKQ